MQLPEVRLASCTLQIARQVPCLDLTALVVPPTPPPLLTYHAAADAAANDANNAAAAALLLPPLYNNVATTAATISTAPSTATTLRIRTILKGPFAIQKYIEIQNPES